MEWYILVDWRNWATLIAPGLNLTGRAMGRMRAEANRQVGNYWHHNFVPKKFKASNTQYRLQKRRDPYLAIKRQIGVHGYAMVNGRVIKDRVIAGGTVNLVRSGTLGKMAQAPSHIRATPLRATVTQTVPRFATINPRDGKPDMRAELSAVTDSEHLALTVVWGNTFREQLLKYRARHIESI